MHWHAWGTSPTPHKPTQDLKPRGQEQTITDRQCAWLFTSYHSQWLFYTFFKPPHGDGPCKEGVQHTRPWGQRPGDHCARMVSLEGQQGRRGATLYQMHGGHPHLPAKGLWVGQGTCQGHRLFAGRARGSVQAVVPGRWSKGRVARVQASSTIGDGDIAEEDGNMWKWWAVVQ